ncbi:MAG: carbamoyltransferase HypF [Actinobacteria bacterium]|nr:carbamoyltransferase HypF [Actinomycetota bacterium]
MNVSTRADLLSHVERRRVRVWGIVQGVGFRPFVQGLAVELGLAGLVGNDAQGVFIEIEGPPVALDEFARRLVDDAPRLANITSVSVDTAPVEGTSAFEIVESQATDGVRASLPPDVAMCPECRAEIDDPGARRYRHPFANCTQCGPRLTVIRDLPYDRPATTMAAFEMCPDCAAEYADPLDRRHHAQPIACPACGPQLAFDGPNSAVAGTDAALAAAHRVIADGGVVAVKGVGGYHLVCDASNEAAVATLRARKERPDKPFALMAASVQVAERLVEVDAVAREALLSPAAPVVLLPRRGGSSGVASAVAPGNPLLGVMLPPSPLHHLLLRPVPGHDTPVPQVVVLTSGNLSDEPIAFLDDDARSRLEGLVDGWLVHDRPIHVPVDDSVVRVVAGTVHPVRRSRGYAPVPVTLPFAVPPTLAVGGEIKNTFCLADGSRAWVSQHIGDMGNLETLHAFERTVDSFTQMYRVTPEVIAVDQHPGYLTRRWGLDHVGDARVVEVQHHHAHVAALMAEHGLGADDTVVGLAFDGTGHGRAADGSVELWGGEVLYAGYRSFERIAHLRPLPLPSGDGGVRNPCRTAVVQLLALGIAGVDTLPPALACEPTELSVVRHQAMTGLQCVPTTSMGRLFDVVSSIIGVRQRVHYEAQAAIELEALAASHDGPVPTLEFVLRADGVIDPEPLLRHLVGHVARGTSSSALALAFHLAVARMVQQVAERSVLAHRVPLALTGGVFQNALLTRLVLDRLTADGHTVLTHRVVPANDGGLALGQAVIAGLARQGRD